MWFIPNIANINRTPQQHEQIQSVIDKDGRIYLFVGSNVELGKMIIIGTRLTDLFWSLGGINNPPFARYGYTATLTDDGLIIYIGGVYQNGSYANMNEVCLYNNINLHKYNNKLNEFINNLY